MFAPKKWWVVGFFIVALILTTSLAGGALAEEKPWWPFKVIETSTGQPKVVDYVPLQEKASQKWNIIALVPHMKDTS